MRSEHYKQVACVSETSPQAFEQKINTILAGITNPEIVLDRTRPFTAYIIYKVRKDVPETVLELLELLDPESKRATCKQCPHFKRSNDRRKKWHPCDIHGRRHEDQSVCEQYYLERQRELDRAIAEYRNIPFEIE